MSEERKKIVERIITWALDKKAEEIRHIDVKGKTDFTDSIIICHGSAELHIKAIANHILEMARKENLQILSVEGKDNATWVLIDMGDIVVHIFNQETRDYYKIEDIYKRSPKNRNKEKENAKE